MSPDVKVVEDLAGLPLLRKWKTTLARAKKQVRPYRENSAARRLATRIRSLRPIKSPVFILGCPRSGTTFLGSVMESIPSSSYYFEPPILKYYSRLVFEGRMSAAATRRIYAKAFHALLLAAPGNGPRIIEKNPKHTWIARRLLQVFPDAKFIFIHRDGRDVALSLLAKPWHRRDSVGQGKREPGGYLYGPYPHFYIESHRHQEYEDTTDYHRAIWIWRRYAEEMEKLRDELPEPCQFHLRYEELVRQPEQVVRPLVRFLDEPDDVLQSIMTVADQGHAGSVGKWKTQLGEEEHAATRSEAGEMLRFLGYADQETAVT